MKLLGFHAPTRISVGVVDMLTYLSPGLRSVERVSIQLVVVVTPTFNRTRWSRVTLWIGKTPP